MKHLSTAFVAVAALLAGAAAIAQPDEVNVAAARWGATARASSEFGPGYEARNVLDGRWSSRETDKWNTRSHVEPHWLVIDLGRVVKACRVLIRHEGVYGGGSGYNTRDFSVQAGAGPDGPWHDLVPPIRGNTADLTEHRFAPTPVRWVRLLVTRGERDGNEFARIFEVEVYARRSDLESPLVAAAGSNRVRRGAGGLEQAIAVEATYSGRLKPVAIRLDGGDRVPLGPVDASGIATGWIAAVAQPRVARAEVEWEDGVGKAHTLSTTAALAPVALPSAAFPARLANSTIHIVSSSHQDVAWMDTPQRCIEQRDRQVISPALEIMRRDPGFRFCMEDTLALMEYWQRHPERRAEITRLTREGRLEWGATFNQPYEGLESGESLVRQVLYGRGWIHRNLPGCDSVVAWSPDVPGRTLQMPQILAKGGVKYLMLSRQKEGFSRWTSPDGSGVVAFSPGHYGNAWERLRGPVDRVAGNVAEDMSRLAPSYMQQRLADAFGYLISVDSSGPSDFADLRRAWPTVEGGTPAIPRLRSSTSRDFLDAVTAGSELPTIQGERPNVWLYIHGPTHRKAIADKRAAARLLPGAEAFSVLRCLAEGSPASYPTTALRNAWMAQIYPDHGWGGYYGELTDEVFAGKLRRAREVAARVTGQATGAIAAQVRPVRPGRPIVVFNSLSWQRTGPVEVVVPAPPRGRMWTVTDSSGRPCETQMVAPAPGGKVRLLLIARGVPSLGYATFYLAPCHKILPAGVEPSMAGQVAAAERATPVTRVETPDYRITLATGGIRDLYDRSLGRSMLRTDKWLGGELFTMQSVGNGAGEFTEVQQPTMEEFDRLSRYPVEWRWVERGPVREVAELRSDRQAAGFRHCSVVQRLIVYRTIKRIDLETRLLDWDGTPYREFRLAFPVAATGGKVAYEVPMGTVQVGRDELPGAAGERYVQKCADARPREVQDWIEAGDARGTLTVSSDTAVCDYLDPTAGGSPNPVLQPILLASRRSCHWLGNWYLQPGDHTYRFSVLSHAGDRVAARRYAAETNSPMVVVMPGSALPGAGLPDRLSLCTVSTPGTVVTAMKLTEDGSGVALRLCEMDGKDARAGVTVPFGVRSARRTDLLEEGGRPATAGGRGLKLPVGHNAIESVVLRPTAWRVAQ